MMKTIEFHIAGTTSEKKYYLPLKDASRLVSANVGVTAAQTSTATVKFGKQSETNTILDINLNGTGAGEVAKAAYNSSATDSEKAQAFDLDTPVEILVNLAATSDLMIQLVVDPFLIGAHEGL